MRNSDRSRCWGDTSCQPRGCADLIKARSLASVDPRQYHTKLARADSATTRGPYVGDDDAVFHLGDARRDHVTRSTSGQGGASSYPMQITGQKLIGHRRGSFRLRSTKTVCLCVKAFSLRLTRVQNYLIANWLSNTPKLMSRCMTALGAKRSRAHILASGRLILCHRRTSSFGARIKLRLRRLKN